MTETVVVLGASSKPARYSHRALLALRALGHTVVPVHPELDSIEGIPVVSHISAIRKPVDTVTLYVSPERLLPMIPEVIALRPKRIIANPGAESAPMAAAAKNAGILYLEACTLVMLSTGQF